MDDRHGSPDPRVGIARRILSASQRRLEGRWEDPSAWRTLCEETVAAWRAAADVRWALLVPEGGLGPVVPDADAVAGSVHWSADSGHVTWSGPLPAAALWTALEGPSGTVIGGAGTPPGIGWDEGTGRSQGWLARAIPGGRGMALALVLGLDRPVHEPAADDPLAGDLVLVTDDLGPVFGLRRRLADVAADLGTLRSECETLSRLGDMRSRLAAVTAHELKTPLTSITAYAEVLEQQAGDPNFVHGAEFLRVIRGEADRLLRLVDRLLDSSRRGRMPALIEPEPVAAEPLIDEVLRTLAPQAATRDLQLIGRVPGELPRIDGDSDLIRQVLMNLLGNALKFTPAGGRVVVTAREDASLVRLAVADNGPGIPPHEMRAIFQSFYRTRGSGQTEGVGLGLSIVKEIVDLHGGHLDVHSRLGRGATFGVLLPKQQHFPDVETRVIHHGCDPALQRRLTGHTLRLVAELASARGVAVFMPAAESGDLVVAGFMGLADSLAAVTLPPASELGRAVIGEAAVMPAPTNLPAALATHGREPGGVMAVPISLGSQRRGLVLATRRLGGGVFGDDDLVLLRVVGEILGHAWAAALAPTAERRIQEMMVEALAALSGLRRSGVPTVDPLALRLLSRTGRRLGLSSYEIRLLQYAGALHDTGMVLLDPDVLQKPGALDVDERDHVDRHPQRTLDLLGPLVEVPELQAIIRHHHERVDGRGYPEGRRGDAIPLGSRILAVVDAFFAMVRSRPWREGLSVAAATNELQRHAGAQFDDHVVASFLGVLQEEGLLAEPVVEGPAASGQRR